MTETVKQDAKSTDGVGDVFLTLRRKEYARQLLRDAKRLKDELNVTVTLPKGQSIAEAKEEPDAPPTNDDIEAAREDCLSRLDKIFDAPGRKEDRRIASDTLILVLERMGAYKIGQRAIALGLRKIPRSRTKLQRGDSRTEQFADWLSTFAATRYQIEPAVPFFVRRRDAGSEPEPEPEAEESPKTETSPAEPADAADKVDETSPVQPSPTSEEEREALQSKLNPGAIPFLPNWALPAPKSVAEPTQLLLRGGIPEPVATAKRRALELLAEYRHATHFVGIRITNAGALEEVRKLLQQLNLRHGDSFVPPAGLHINLCSLRCFTPEHLEKASRLLHCAQDIFADDTDLHVRLRGVRQHKGRVLFIPVDPSAALEHARQRLLGYFRQHAPELVSATAEDSEAGLVHRPHVTLLKTRNNNGVWQSIEKPLFEEWSKHDFGADTITQLDLCAADERKKDGYYSVVASVTVVAPPVKRVRSPTSAAAPVQPDEATTDAPLTQAEEKELGLIDPELDAELRMAEERKMQLPDAGAELTELTALKSATEGHPAKSDMDQMWKLLSHVAPTNRPLPPNLERLPDYQPPQQRQGNNRRGHHNANANANTGTAGTATNSSNHQQRSGRKPQAKQQGHEEGTNSGGARARAPAPQEQQEHRQRRQSPAANAGGQQSQQQKASAAAKRKWVVKDA